MSRTARGGKPPVPALDTGQFRSFSPPNMVILETGGGGAVPFYTVLCKVFLIG